MSNIDVLVPIDFERSIFQLLWHMRRISRETSEAGLRIVFSINNRGLIPITAIRRFVNSENAVFVEEKYTGNVNRSRLRNRGLKACGEKVFLSDVDITYEKTLLDWIKQQSNREFLMIPCLYQAKYSKNIDLRIATLRQLRRNFSHIAIPSSLILINNGVTEFDENFIGHGYEDFDFIIQYLLKSRLIRKDEITIKNDIYESFLQVDGLRLVLSRFAIDAIKDGRFAKHIHHKRGNLKKYKTERSNNLKYFQRKYDSFSDEALKKGPYELLIDKAIDIGKFPGKLLLI